MAQETFTFSSSALRSLRLQRELLEREDRRRALARESATRRFQPEPPRPPRRPQYCRDPTVHNALYTGDLLRIKSIFKDETTTNLVMETVSEELVWEPEQGTGLGLCGRGGPFPSLQSNRGRQGEERWLKLQLLGGRGGGLAAALLWDGERGDPKFAPLGISWLGWRLGDMGVHNSSLGAGGRVWGVW